jgi:tetratricopeptide (TPR) repeat protein
MMKIYPLKGPLFLGIPKIKKIIFISLFLFISMAFPALAEKRIAVLPFDVPDTRPDMKQFGIGITDTLNIALSNIKEFIMIDRSQLEAIMKEQAFQNSGFIDSDTAVKLGKLMGAEMLVIGSIQSEEDNYRISARLTDVETGKILKAVQVTGTSIFDLQDKLALEMIAQQNVTPSPGVMSRIKKILLSTGNQTAYDYYLRGRNKYLLFTIKGYQEAIKLFDQALETDKNYTLALASKAEAQALLSLDMELDGKPYKSIMEDAEANARQAVKQDSELADAHRALSLVFKMQARAEDGKNEALRAIELNPNDAEAYYLLWANSNSNLDDPLFQKAIKINPYIVKKHLAIGVSYFKRSKYKEAIEIYQEALKINPGFAMTYVALGFAYEKNGDLENAEIAFKTAAKIRFYIADVHVGLGLVNFRKGKVKEAIAEFNSAININPNNSYAHTGLGYVYFYQKKPEEALKEYQAAIEINPDDYYARNTLGNYYYSKGEYEKALEQYQIATGINYFDVDSYYHRALVYRVQGKTEQAINSFKEALKINPEYTRAYTKLAELYQGMNKTDEAINCYQSVLAYKPDDPVAHYSLGIIYYQQNKIDQAISHYKSVLLINPDDVNTHNNLGTAYFVQEKMEEAVTEYKAALKIKPNDLNANQNLGLAYERQNRNEEAVLQFKKVCKLGNKDACDWLKSKI